MICIYYVHSNSILKTIYTTHMFTNVFFKIAPMRNIVATAAALLLLSGCASPLMSPVDESVAVTQQADAATVTFFRTSVFGSAIQAPVAEGRGSDVDFVGIVSKGYRVRHSITPGEHMFVVGGESSNLIKGTFEPNKNYYVLISPRMGWLKARFAFEPLSKEKLADESVQAEIRNCQLMTPNEAGLEWFESNRGSMRGKLIYAISDFNPETDPIIQAEDGIEALY